MTKTFNFELKSCGRWPGVIYSVRKKLDPISALMGPVTCGNLEPVKCCVALLNIAYAKTNLAGPRV